MPELARGAWRAGHLGTHDYGSYVTAVDPVPADHDFSCLQR
jgi:hypothetical protein